MPPKNHDDFNAKKYVCRTNSQLFMTHLIFGLMCSFPTWSAIWPEQVGSGRFVLLLLQQRGHRCAIHQQHRGFPTAGGLDVAMLCGVKAASVPAASLETGQDMEQHWELVADVLWPDEYARTAAVHVLHPPQWLTKPFEATGHLLRRGRAQGDVGRGLPAAGPD